MCLWHICTFYRGFHLRHKSNLLVELLARRWVTREIFSHVKILWLAQQVTAAVIGIFAMCSWKPITIILTWGFVMSVWWKSSKVVTNTHSKEVCQFPKVKYLLICQSTNLLQHKQVRECFVIGRHQMDSNFGRSGQKPCKIVTICTEHREWEDGVRATI